MNKKRIFFIVLILFVLAVISISIYILLKNNATNTPENKLTHKSQQEIKKIIDSTQKITLTNTGFEPKSVSIALGTRVVWTNLSGEKGTVNSDPYPNNGLWKFLNLGVFGSAENMSIIFEKPGTYGYHNLFYFLLGFMC